MYNASLEIFTLPECWAALIGNYRRFGTPISSIFNGRVDQEEFLDILKDRKSHLHRRGSLKSRIAYHVCHVIVTVKRLVFLKSH
jgi:hypothetical protein